MAVFITVKQFASQHPALTESGIRWCLFNAEYNGLAKSGAVLRVGRKVLIDPTQFMAWMRTNPRTSPPGAKPARPRGDSGRGGRLTLADPQKRESPGSDGCQRSEKRLDDQGCHARQQQAEHPLQQRKLAGQVATQHIEIAAQ